MAKRPSADDELSRDVDGYLSSERVDDIAAYAARGRVFERLGDQDLEHAWLSAVRYMVDNYSREASRKVNDLAAEMELRGKSVPYELVKPEVDKLSKLALGTLAEIKRTDPVRYEEISDSIAEDVEDFKSRRDTTKT